MNKKELRKKMKKISEFIQKNKKLAVLVAFVLLAVVSLTYLKTKNLSDKGPKELYEVLVMTRDETVPAGDDASKSLKKGDVLLAVKSPHEWSDTEKVSYLILKMNLSENEAQKVVALEEREKTKAEKKEELRKYSENNPPAEELERYKEEIEREKVVLYARKYRIDMDEFPDFEPNMLLNGQPYYDEVYDFGIMEEGRN